MLGAEELVARVAPAGSQLVGEKRMRSLWAGYGSVSQLVLEVAPGARGGWPRERLALIIKRVEAPNDEGVGHERKLRSYLNEGCFYRELAPQLLAEGISVPEPLLVEANGRGQLTLVMRDQRDEFPSSAGALSLAQAKAALSWLAAFHAHFWGQPPPAGLWEQGTFWHLDTRREEFTQMDWRALADAAEQIDAYLKGEAGDSVRDHMTVVHGDFKEANLLFSADGSRCAAHDFQYCGGGLGAKDIAYLFCSGLGSGLLPAREGELLAHYHGELTARLGPRGLGEGYTPAVMARHLDYALADFVRFMDGWGYWGNNAWAEAKVAAFLETLGRGCEEA